MSRLFRLGSLAPGLLLLALLSGCGSSEPFATIKKVTDAQNRLSDLLEKVHDAESARAATPEIISTFQEVNQLMATIPALHRKYGDALTTKRRAEKLEKDIEAASNRLGKQFERITTIRGLPTEFWSAIRLNALEFINNSLDVLSAVESSGSQATPIEAKEAREYLIEAQKLLAANGHEKVILVDFENLSSGMEQAAFDRIKRLAPNAQFVNGRLGDNVNLMFGPVDDYQSVLNGIDFGSITFEDEGQRRIVIMVDRRKLGGHPGSGMTKHPLASAKRPKDFDRMFEEQKARMREAMKGMPEAGEVPGFGEPPEGFGPGPGSGFGRGLGSGSAPARIRPSKLDPDDPEYFEKLADRMTSDDRSARREAIDVFLRIDPTEVPSAETRKKIARNFRSLVYEINPPQQEKCIRGLALWAGKYSVPVLIGLLENEKATAFNRELLYRTLGDLGDARAAKPVARRWTNFFERDEAYDCLRRLGPAAEEAIIEIVPSLPLSEQFRALDLLAQHGTKKSLAPLREAKKHPNLTIRERAKQAAARIRQREAEKAE